MGLAGASRSANKGQTAEGGGRLGDYREQEEELGELALAEVVREILLRIGTHTRDVAIGTLMLTPQRFDTLFHIFRYLAACTISTSAQIRADPPFC